MKQDLQSDADRGSDGTTRRVQQHVVDVQTAPRRQLQHLDSDGKDSAGGNTAEEAQRGRERHQKADRHEHGDVAEDVHQPELAIDIVKARPDARSRSEIDPGSARAANERHREDSEHSPTEEDTGGSNRRAVHVTSQEGRNSRRHGGDGREEDGQRQQFNGDVAQARTGRIVPDAGRLAGDLRGQRRKWVPLLHVLCGQ